MLKQTKGHEATWFNVDENFRSSWNTALDLKNKCVVQWWLPLFRDSPDDVTFNNLLRKLKSRLTEADVKNTAVETAKHQLEGLIQVSPDETVGSGDHERTAFMQCAASANLPGLRILIAASADIHQIDKVQVNINKIWFLSLSIQIYLSTS